MIVPVAYLIEGIQHMLVNDGWFMDVRFRSGIPQFRGQILSASWFGTLLKVYNIKGVGLTSTLMC
jgi:hypothetical protein